MKLQIYLYFLFSAEYYLMQNIGVAANFPLKLKQLEIDECDIYILAHFTFSHALFFLLLINFLLVNFELGRYFCLQVTV